MFKTILLFCAVIAGGYIFVGGLILLMYVAKAISELFSHSK